MATCVLWEHEWQIRALLPRPNVNLIMTEENFAHYKLGFDEVDREHWSLIELMEKAKHASKNRDARALIGYLDKLNEAIISHFKNEEEFMLKIKYPYFQAHKQHHDMLLSNLKNIVLSAKTGNDSRIATHHMLVNDLELIVVKHIDEQDMQIATFIKSKSDKTYK